MENTEIKFKAWDKVAKKMSPEFHLFGEFLLLGAIHSWQAEVRGDTAGSSLEMLNDLVILRYTGMKDNFGKEIYEGDLVKSDLDRDEDCGIENLRTSPSLITFVHGGFYADYDPTYGPGGNLTLYELLNASVSDKNAENIGSMYEHPQLIGQ